MMWCMISKTMFHFTTPCGCNAIVLRLPAENVNMHRYLHKVIQIVSTNRGDATKLPTLKRGRGREGGETRRKSVVYALDISLEH